MNIAIEFVCFALQEISCVRILFFLLNANVFVHCSTKLFANRETSLITSFIQNCPNAAMIWLKRCDENQINIENVR